MDEEVPNIGEAFAEANKEYSVVRELGDLYVSLLRCSRSADRNYRVQAVQSLSALLQTLSLKPETPMMEVVERASRRVALQEEPDSEYHQALGRICRAAITYMIEAADYGGGSLLTCHSACNIDPLSRGIGVQN
jgi:hypothetical protein